MIGCVPRVFLVSLPQLSSYQFEVLGRFGELIKVSLDVMASNVILTLIPVLLGDLLVEEVTVGDRVVLGLALLGDTAKAEVQIASSVEIKSFLIV